MPMWRALLQPLASPGKAFFIFPKFPALCRLLGFTPTRVFYSSLARVWFSLLSLSLSPPLGHDTLSGTKALHDTFTFDALLDMTTDGASPALVTGIWTPSSDTTSICFYTLTQHISMLVFNCSEDNILRRSLSS